MAQIISFTGSSGVGKTSLSKAVIEHLPQAGMILSYTTREPRESDLPGEYAYISEPEFLQMEKEGKFLWTAERRGIRYGTVAKDVADAANDPTRIGIMILVVERVQTLRDYLKTLGKLEVHVPIFIPTPSKEVLVKRLNIRGDQMAEIEKRLSEDASWEAQIRELSIPFHYISNDATIERGFEEVNELL